jgi:dTDP-4-dehydrorhamnose reductase
VLDEWMNMSEILDRTIIVGGAGALGSYADFGVRKDRESLDVSNLASVRAVFKELEPKAVLHLAAETDAGKCEDDPAHACLVNAVGTYHVALAAREAGARMVYVSSAGVFGGDKIGAYGEDDLPDPPNVYGHSKYLGELAVRGLLENHLIVRPCWIFGGGAARDKKFVGKIMAQVRNPETKELRATGDEIGSPTYAKDLMGRLRELVQGDERGVVHVANAGGASRFEVAQFIAGIVAPNLPVASVPLALFNLKTKITKNQVLSSRIGLMRPWQEALREYLEKEW